MAGFFVLFLPEMIRILFFILFCRAACAQVYPVELCWDLSKVNMSASYPGAQITWSVYGVSYSDTFLSVPVTDTGIIPVNMTAVDQFGCQADRTVYLNAQYCAVINFPVSFTPNGDNVNDVWFPKYAGLISIESVEVYSRWGGIVWEGTQSGWDGNLPDGSPAPIDIYTFKAAYYRGGIPTVRVGSITLIR